MKRVISTVVATLLVALTALNSRGAEGPVRVELKNVEGKWQLTRDGQPYFIKGVGGDASKKLALESGANSFRTWGAEDIGDKLDEAQKLGLSVTVGIWLGHERHGFNYNNSNQVAEQYEKARQAILKYKDHPAVLLWAIGNEMEGYEKGDNAAIWSAINNIAAMARKVDPNHPTMTVVAEIGGERVKNMHRLCPDIDIVGINSYAGVASIPSRYKEAGGTKPYIITEFGPPGTWEIQKNSFGAVAEPSSTEKGNFYRNGYQKGIASQPGLCLGSYAFSWGSKQEATATWYGMVLPDGTKLEAVDVMTEMWTGKAPAIRCPQVESLKIAGPDQVDLGQTVHVDLKASDPQKDALKVKWVLSREVENYNTGGDKEDAPPTFPEAITKSGLDGADLKLPADGGIYRLFVYATNAHNASAVANVPIQVKGPASIVKARVAKLPLVVYGDDLKDPPYAPAGWMGKTDAIAVDEKCAVNPHTGKTCIKVEFSAADNWGGVIWQNPVNDWGDRAGGLNLTGAKKVTFWAKGEKGGEKVAFKFGILGKDKKYPDSATGLLESTLTNQWQQFTIDVTGKDLSRIKTGFGWSLAGQGGPVAFYIDDIQWE